MAIASCPSRSWSAAMPRSWSNSPRRRDHALDDRSQRRAQEQGRYTVLRCRDHRAAAQVRQAGDRRRQGHLLRETDRDLDEGDAYALYEFAKGAGVKHGVVQDKLWLPGLVKLKTLIDQGFFGEVLACAASSVTGFSKATQSRRNVRPGITGRKDDGGIIVDMLCHWRYVLDNLFGAGRERSVVLGATHPKTLGRARQALQGGRRRCRVRDLPARRRRDCAHQQFVVRCACAGTIS